MNLITERLKKDIEQFILIPILQGNPGKAAGHSAQIIDQMYENIPSSKRLSYGRIYAIKSLSNTLIDMIEENEEDLFEAGKDLFDAGRSFKARGVGLGLLAQAGQSDYKTVLPYFESAADDDDWNLRELAAIFLRRIITNFSQELLEYLKGLAKSDNPRIRRFAAETLRPVNENQWFFEKPDYPLEVLRLMFCEEDQYPRTSVGNNLSDLSRRLPERVLALVAELVSSGNKNAYWIAYRACRNLVKTRPVEVMDLLKVDEYKFKDRSYRRADYR